MTTLTEGTHAGEFIVSEANAGSTGVSRSREAIVVTSGQNLVAGAVYGIISGKAVEYDNGGAAGANAAAGVLFDAVDASAADADGVGLVRDCEVNLNEIVFDSGQDAAAQAAAVVDLLALGVIAR